VEKPDLIFRKLTAPMFVNVLVTENSQYARKQPLYIA